MVRIRLFFMYIVLGGIRVFIVVNLEEDMVCVMIMIVSEIYIKIRSIYKEKRGVNF